MNEAGERAHIQFGYFAHLIRWGADCDRLLSTALRRLCRPPLDLAMRGFSALGSERTFVPAAIVFTALFYALHRPRAALTVIACALLTLGCIRLAKRSMHRARPPVTDLTSSSFPSGHAMAGVAVYGAAAVAVAQIYPDLSGVLWFAVPAAAILIGLSRTCLGFHWLSDVLAGLAIGGVILAVSRYALG
jgi:undecaprenyl-diphosphatase